MYDVVLFFVGSRPSVRNSVCVTREANENVSEEFPPGCGLNCRTKFLSACIPRMGRAATYVASLEQRIKHVFWAREDARGQRVRALHGAGVGRARPPQLGLVRVVSRAVGIPGSPGEAGRGGP